MAAIHLARGATGRDVVLKMEGSYHGHHDSVMVSVRPPLDQLGDRDEPSSLPFGAGHPDAIRQLTKAVPFNDADALEHALQRYDVAAVIVEPAMMNITIVCPRPGALMCGCGSRKKTTNVNMVIAKNSTTPDASRPTRNRSIRKP